MTFCKLLAIWSFYYFYYFFMKVLYCLSLKFPGLTSWEWRPPQTGPSFVTEGTVYNFVNVCRSRARTILLWWRANARFKRRTFYEPNLIQQIKLMRSSTFELIKLQLIVFGASSVKLLAWSIRELRLWFKRRSRHEPNQMHKLLSWIYVPTTHFFVWLLSVFGSTELNTKPRSNRQ